MDHILTNDTSNIIYPCIFLSEISDNFPVGCLVAHYEINSNNNNQKSKTTKYVYRDESKFDNEQFTSDLCISLRSSFIKQKFDSSSEVDQNFSSFVNIFNECVNRHAPLQIASCKTMKLLKKSWITKGILKSVEQKMYVSEYLNGTDLQKMFYRQYANKLSKI